MALAHDKGTLLLSLARYQMQAGGNAQAKAALDKLARKGQQFAQQDEAARLQKSLVSSLPGR